MTTLRGHMEKQHGVDPNTITEPEPVFIGPPAQTEQKVKRYQCDEPNCSYAAMRILQIRKHKARAHAAAGEPADGGGGFSSEKMSSSAAFFAPPLESERN